MRVYLAAPFFTPVQVAIVDRIEATLAAIAVPHFSPRRDGPGVLADLPPDERQRRARRVFEANVAELDFAELVVAVVDDRDVGVAWELGYAYARRPRPYIVTFTEAGHGLNVMIRECVDGHVRGVDELRTCLETLRFEDYRNFDARVY